MRHAIDSLLSSLRAAIRFTLLVLTACTAPAARPPVTDGIVPLSDGDSLAFRLVGQGRDTIVALAGGPALGSRYLEAAFGDLGRDHAVVFYDMRGRGRSVLHRDGEPLGLGQDVADLEALRQFLGLEQLTVLAHHWGGAVLLRYAQLHPGRVRRAVLVAPYLAVPEFVYYLAKVPNDSAALAHHSAALAAGLPASDPARYCADFWGFGFSPAEETAPAVVRALAPSVCEAPAAELQGREELRRRILAGSTDWAWVDSLRTVDVPVLMLSGTETFGLARGAIVWADSMPQAKVQVLGPSAAFPWVGHETDALTAVRHFLGGATSVATSAPPMRDTVTRP